MIEGYYVTCDDAECLDCYEAAGGFDTWKHAMGGFEDWEEPIGISSYEESDTPTHCRECGKLLCHSLTSDGYDYVAEAIVDDFRDGERTPVTSMWANYYGEGVSFDDFNIDADPETVLWLHRMLPENDHSAYDKHREQLQEMEAT
jgi:hypothetical protein